ncbi:DUF1273 family protein [Clostridiaceae bacterium]|nr:DUF1273 family protein [Clostridiaceae bacterium]
MTEQELRQHRCCFTGHRPEKLDRPEAEVIEGLKKEIRTAIADGFRTFISGMARGVDLWAAEIVLDLRANGAAIRLICASPYRGFEVRWSQDWQERYRRVMEQANLVRFICPSYSRDCFQRRNEWMIDHSARVIAVNNGRPGGTRNTAAYAKRNGVPVVNVLLKSNSDVFIK